MPKLAPVLHPLQTLVTSLGITQAAFSEKVEVRPGKSLGSTQLSLIVRQGIWPKLGKIGHIKDSMRVVLTELKADPTKIEEALDALKLPELPSGSLFLTPSIANLLEDTMILQRQTLTSDAQRHFGLFRTPFPAEIREASELFESREIRYVRESMWQTVEGGDFIAVIGESGSGKTTLVKDIRDRSLRHKSGLGGSIIIFSPPVIGMDKNINKGYPLKAVDIAADIIRQLAPQETIPSRPSTCFKKLEVILTNSHRAGNKHLLLIEEAHELPTPTLKQLKRFHEMDDGFAKLLGILLVGQQELKDRLTHNIYDVREVVQRIGIIELRALDADLEGYLTHKLKVVGKQLGDVFTDDAVDAMRERLMTETGRRDKKEWLSMIYPLTVNNMATAAMNSAAELGKRVVDASIVQEL